MSFKKKMKKAMKKMIGDTSGITWKDLDHKKVYGLIAVIIAVIILAIVLLGGSENTDVKQPEVTDEAVAEEAAEEAVDENPLEVDAYEEINTLVLKYFHGLSTGDIPLVEDVVDVLTEEEIQTIEKKKDYIEAYEDIVCYTKKGLEENSYVVFASYEMKIYNIETPAPGIMALYVTEGDDGDFFIYNGEASEELTNYVLELAAEEEVAAVIADVDSRYQKLVEEDEDLGKFAQTMLESQQAAEEAEEEDEAESEEAEVDNDEEAAELDEPVKTKVTDGIRVRAERSTESQIRSTLVSGTEVEVFANYSDGWSKIKYLENEGYCKTEYLESTEGVPMISENAEEEPEEEQQEETTASENSDVTAVNKEMKITDAIRIRAGRSTDTEQIGSGYAGQKVTVIGSYSDGWSKIKFGNEEGYCKTEFLQ